MTISFYLGKERNLYRAKFKLIVKYFLKTGEIKAKNKKRANSKTFRHMVDKIYYSIKEKEKEG